MIIRIFFLAFGLLGIFNLPAQAQIFLEQAKVNLDVTAGEHLNGSLLVHNTSTETIFIKVYWEDFEYKAPYDGTKNFLPAGTAPGSASQWVTFLPQTFNIPAYGTQKIDYAVSVPSTMNEGHYGVLFFERTSSAKLNDEAVNLVTRIGCLFFIEPKDKSKKADLTDISLKGNSLWVDFVNQGNATLLPHTTYYIMQEGGLVLHRGEAKKLYVPQGVSAPLEIPLKTKLGQGSYTVVVNSDLEDGDVVIKEIGLVVDSSGQIAIKNSQD